MWSAVDQVGVMLARCFRTVLEIGVRQELGLNFCQSESCVSYLAPPLACLVVRCSPASEYQRSHCGQARHHHCDASFDVRPDNDVNVLPAEVCRSIDSEDIHDTNN